MISKMIDSMFKKVLKDKLMTLDKEELANSLTDIYAAIVMPTTYTNIANVMCQNQQTAIRYEGLNQQFAACHQTINELIKKIEEHEKTIEKNT